MRATSRRPRTVNSRVSCRNLFNIKNTPRARQAFPVGLEDRPFKIIYSFAFFLFCSTAFFRNTFSQRVAWRVVVLDEGHKVKNEETRISKSVRKLHATSVLLLTVSQTPDDVAVAVVFFLDFPVPTHMSLTYALVHMLLLSLFTLRCRAPRCKTTCTSYGHFSL